MAMVSPKYDSTFEIVSGKKDPGLAVVKAKIHRAPKSWFRDRGYNIYRQIVAPWSLRG